MRPRSQWRACWPVVCWPVVLRVGCCVELLSTDFFFRKGLLWETSLSLVSESSLLLCSLLCSYIRLVFLSDSYGTLFLCSLLFSDPSLIHPSHPSHPTSPPFCGCICKLKHAALCLYCKSPKPPRWGLGALGLLWEDRGPEEPMLICLRSDDSMMNFL